MPHATTVHGDQITQQAIAEAGRALILTPSTQEVEETIEHLVPEGTAVVRADAVEENFDAFVGQFSAVLALANRSGGALPRPHRGPGLRRLGSLRGPAVKGAASRLASLGPDGPPLTANPLRLFGNDRSAGGGPSNPLH
jgi:hypothetical protein